MFRKITFVTSLITLIPCITITEKEKHEFVTLFAHGLGGTCKQYKLYKELSYIIEPVVTLDYNDSAHNNKGIPNLKKVNLAQHEDILMTSSRYDHALQKHAKKVIGMGVSRGASALITATGTGSLPNISALILESPFACMHDVVNNKIEQFYLGWIPGIHKFTHNNALPWLFGQYDPVGIQPIKAVCTIDTNLPILLICSEKDGLVPASSTHRLYQELRATGHEKTHILKTRRGDHANIGWGKEGYKYLYCVHAFRKAYGLPYNEEYAEKGTEIFATTQPQA